jgi:hypothetical protein
MTLQLQGNSQAQGPQASQTWISLPMQLSNRTLLDKNKKKSTYDTISWHTIENDQKCQQFELLELQPKIGIAIALILLVSDCALLSKKATGKKEIYELSEKTMKDFFEEKAKGLGGLR